MSYEDLRSIPIFKGMSEDISGIFQPSAKEEKYEAGKTIFAEGSSADSFFIIKEGTVEIRKSIAEDRHKLIAILLKGEFFGEMAVFTGQPRSAEARAKTDATLLRISKDGLPALFKGNPDAAVKLMGFLTAVLMERLRSTTTELTAVYETGRLVTASHSVPELVTNVMESIFRAVEPAEAGLFVLWNEFNAEFEVAYDKGFGLENASAIPDDDPLIGWFLENKEAFLSFDLKSESRISLPDWSVFKQGLSMVAAPFFSRQQLSGYMLLLNRERQNAFSYNQMVLLSAMSGYVSVALENLNYMQEEIDRYRLSRMKSRIPL